MYSLRIASGGRKILLLNNSNIKKVYIMFKQLTNLFKDELVKVKTVKRTAETRGRKSLSKKQKVLNLLSKGTITLF